MFGLRLCQSCGEKITPRPSGSGSQPEKFCGRACGWKYSQRHRAWPLHAHECVACGLPLSIWGRAGNGRKREFCMLCGTRAAVKRRYRRRRGANVINDRERASRYAVSDAIVARSRTGICEVCSRRASENKPLHIDHDHLTGNFRGLICSSCNIGLGHFKDDPARLTAAISYLKGDR